MTMQGMAASSRTAGAGGAKQALKLYLAKNVNHLAGLLPRGMDERRLARMAMECFREIPQLASCSSQSLIGGVLAAAQCGLALGKAGGGESYLIPYKGEATFIVGVPGRVKLAYRSGHIRAARCGIVYKDQSFEVDEVTGAMKVGMRDPEVNYDDEPGVWYWACVETSAGAPITGYMNRPTVESRRKKLQSKNSPAWRNHFDEMALNMVFRYVLKRCPKSSEQERAEVLDSRVVRPGDGSLVGAWVDTPEGDDVVIDIEPDEEGPQGNLEPPPQSKSKNRNRSKKKAKPKVESGVTDLSLGDEVALYCQREHKQKITGALASGMTKEFISAGLIDKGMHWYEVPDETAWEPVQAAIDKAVGA